MAEGDEAVQLHRVMERIGRSRHGAGLGAHVSFERIGKGRRVGGVRNGAPDREGKPAAGKENSSHLTQPLDTIREELHALLTEDHIEGGVLER